MGVNMDAKTLTIVYLSICLAVLQWLYVKEVRKAEYLKGRASVFAEQGTVEAPMNSCIGKTCTTGRG